LAFDDEDLAATLVRAAHGPATQGCFHLVARLTGRTEDSDGHGYASASLSRATREVYSNPPPCRTGMGFRLSACGKRDTASRSTVKRARSFAAAYAPDRIILSAHGRRNDRTPDVATIVVGVSMHLSRLLLALFVLCLADPLRGAEKDPFDQSGVPIE